LLIFQKNCSYNLSLHVDFVTSASFSLYQFMFSWH